MFLEKKLWETQLQMEKIYFYNLKIFPSNILKKYLNFPKYSCFRKIK